MIEFEPWDQARAAAIIAKHAGRDGAALPILHDLQSVFGYVPQEAIPLVAKALNVTRAEIYGVATFYHDFRNRPPGRRILRLCRAEACQSLGAEALADHAKARLKVDWGGTAADGSVTLEPAFCLGLCAAGPAALLDDRPLARLDAARLDHVLAGES